MLDGKAVDDAIQSALKSMLEVTRCSNSLPKSGRDFELYNSYVLFSDLLRSEGDRIKGLLTNILKHADAKASLNNAITIDEITDTLEKASDLLAERVANYIDEAEGVRKQENLLLVSTGTVIKNQVSLVDASWNKPKSTIFSKFSNNSASQDDTLKLLASKNVARPQLSFQHLIDNSNKPFVSKLQFKHNSMSKSNQSKKLTVYVNEELDAPSSSDVAPNQNPYKYELDHFVPDDQFLQPSSQDEIKTRDKVPVELIEDETSLEKLCKILKSSKEFAVDLEHHSYRTFQGLTCLMQISLDDNDYLIDTLKLWTKMHILNDPFTDPNILKIFHGAQHDVEWLQRDFGIYVVNMFDTGQAMRVLGLARFSLSHLIKTYLNIEMNKEFQLADWRIRPLPQSMIDYARDDTRYLLYCYRRLKNDLLNAGNERKNLLLSVFERSRNLCSNHYEKPLFDESRDYLNLCAMSKKPFNSRQKMALREIYAWRDATARLQDESIGYVLPNHMLLQIAEVLPREMQGLLSCCNPVPPLVRQNLHDLHRMVFKARQAPLETMESTSTDQKPQLLSSRQHVEKPHDFSHIAEDEELVPRTNLEKYLANFEQVAASLLKLEPKLFSLTTTNRASSSKKYGRKEDDKYCAKFVTPFEAYLKAREEQRKMGYVKETSEEAAKPKMYSHLDNRKADVAGSSRDSNGSTDNNFSLNGSKIDLTNDDSSLKRKRSDESESESDQENIHTAVDNQQEEFMHFNRSLDKPTKKKKKKKVAVKAEDIQKYDYDKAEREQAEKIDSAKSTQKPVFDPNKDYMKQKGHNKGRRFGKKESKFLSFGGDKKK